MNPTDPPKKKRWRLLGCLVKGPLGCLAFVVGMLVVFVIFSPRVLGNLFATSFVKHVNTTYEGTLEIGSAWMGSLYGPQDVSGIVLFDPDGGEILRGRVDAPSLTSFVDDDVSTEWGPVRVHFDAISLVEDENGETNLERALTRRESPERSAWSRLESDVQFDDLRTVFSADLVSWNGPSERSVLLRDVVCEATFNGRDRSIRMHAEGRCTVDGRVADSVRFLWDIDDVCIGPLERTGWSAELTTDAVPVALLDALLRTASVLADRFGEEMTTSRLRLSGDVDGVRRIEELQIDGERGYVQLAARWPRASHAIVAGTDDVATFRVSASSTEAGEFLGRTIPLTYDFATTGPGATTEVRLRDFVLPIRGGLDGLRASCEVVSAASTFRFLDEVRERFHLDGRETLSDTARFRIEQGALWYDNFALPTTTGTLVVSGSYRIDTDEYELLATLPDHTSYEVSGPRATLAIEPAGR